MERCEKCSRTATVHETTLADSKVVTRHYCEAHRPEALPTFDDKQRARVLRELAERFRQITPNERAELERLHRLMRRVR